MPRKQLPMLQPPRTVGDCRDGVRPCPWFRCRFNLLIDVLEDGSIVINAKYRRPDGALRVISPKEETTDRFLDEIEDAIEVWFDEISDNPPASCAIDVAMGVASRAALAQHIKRVLSTSEPVPQLDDPDKSGMQLDEIADLMYVSRERVRQIEASGLLKLRDRCVEEGISLEDMISGWRTGSDG